jgi:hypothetical protein
MEYISRSGVRGTYSYRRAVPQELRLQLGKREIKLSLKTADYAAAVIASQVINKQVEAQFEKAREVLGFTTQGEPISAADAYQLAQRT